MQVSVRGFYMVIFSARILRWIPTFRVGVFSVFFIQVIVFCFSICIFRRLWGKAFGVGIGILLDAITAKTLRGVPPYGAGEI